MNARWSTRARRQGLALLTTITVALVPGSIVEAQAFNYPALQIPRASVRDYTAAIAAGSGTSAIFQWREGMRPGLHLGLDAGIADPSGGDDLFLFVGGSLGKELTRSTSTQPLDILLTAGAGAAFGGGTTLFRLPVGVSIGHTFDLEDGYALTPFVHPRLSVDVCDDCGGGGDSDSEVSLSFDLGVSFQVNRQFAVRAAGSFSGSDLFRDDAFAVGFTWTPAALSGFRRR